jgi:hypothetical protein
MPAHQGTHHRTKCWAAAAGRHLGRRHGRPNTRGQTRRRVQPTGCVWFRLSVRRRCAARAARRLRGEPGPSTGETVSLSTESRSDSTLIGESPTTFVVRALPLCCRNSPHACIPIRRPCSGSRSAGSVRTQLVSCTRWLHVRTHRHPLAPTGTHPPSRRAPPHMHTLKAVCLC